MCQHDQADLSTMTTPVTGKVHHHLRPLWSADHDTHTHTQVGPKCPTVHRSPSWLIIIISQRHTYQALISANCPLSYRMTAHIWPKKILQCIKSDNFLAKCNLEQPEKGDIFIQMGAILLIITDYYRWTRQSTLPSSQQKKVNFFSVLHWKFWDFILSEQQQVH